MKRYIRANLEEDKRYDAKKLGEFLDNLESDGWDVQAYNMHDSNGFGGSYWWLSLIKDGYRYQARYRVDDSGYHLAKNDITMLCKVGG